MEIKIKSAAQFQQLLEALAEELVTANIRFKLHAGLSKALPEYVQEFQQSPTFWELTFQSILDAAVFRLCKIYDQNADSLNLRNLLDTIKANIAIFDVEDFRSRLKVNPFVESLTTSFKTPDKGQLQSDLEFVSASNPLVKNLVIWRNNFFAHRGTGPVIDGYKIVEDYPLSAEEVGRLLDEGMRILNRYSSLFCANTYSTNMVGRDDFKSVLESIREHLKLVERRIEEDIKRWGGGASSSEAPP